MRPLLLGACVVLVGCSKCGSRIDSPVADAGARPQLAVVDARTAVLTIYPEYRGTAVLATTVAMTREVPELDDQRLAAALVGTRFQPVDGGWALSAYRLTRPTPTSLRLELSYDPEQLGNLYVSSTAVSSEELAYYLPRALPGTRDVFTFDVSYRASAQRAEALLGQVAKLLSDTGLWKVELSPPDAGWDIVRATHDNGARVGLERDGGHVEAHYELRTSGAR